MNKNRILSLILSVMMVFTFVFSTGVFAEEIDAQDYEPEVEEIEVEIGFDDAAEEAEHMAEEQAASEESDQQIAETEDESLQPVEEEQTVVEQEAAEEQAVLEDQEEVTPVESETAVEEETEVVAAEVVDEEAATEEAATEEDALEDAEEEELPFVQGYVRVNDGAIVYADEAAQEELGAFSGEAIVYATVSTAAAEEAESWLQIVFDTAEAKEADEEPLKGYVQFKDVKVLTDEEVEQLTEALKNDNAVRSYDENLLPSVSFKAVEAEAADEITEEQAIETLAEDEEIIETEAEEAEEVADEVELEVASTVEILTQPVDCAAAVGETATFTVKATGAASYQWQYNNGRSWKNYSIDTAKTDTFSIAASTTRYTYQYRCEVTGEDGTVLYTDTVKIVVPFAITEQPVDCAAAVGEMATFTVKATGAASYQWQYNNGRSWKNYSIDTAKTDTFSIAASTTRYTYQYRCEVTGEDGTVLYTDAVKIIVPFAITEQPVDFEAAVGETATFTVKATGAASYQWQYNNGRSWKNYSIDTAETDTFSIAASTTRYTYQYRCEVTGEDGTVLYTDAVKIVKPPIIIDDVTYDSITATTCYVVSYSGTASSLTIPNTVEGMTVTEIGEEAFMNNKQLESIDLPDTITVIRARAFKGCTSLSDMH